MTWSMYATLYGKPSPFRSWAENSFIGFTMGLNIVVTADYVFRTGIQPLGRGNWFPAVGILLGILMVLRLFPRYSYVSRIPIAISIGTNLGLSLRTQIFTGFINQITATIVPFWVPGNLYQSLANTTVSVSVVMMLTFFLYSTKLEGPLKYTSKIGEYILYIALGAVFAQTFMGRLGLLVGYLQSITDPAWQIPYTLGFAVVVMGGVLALDRYGILEKYAD
ncbi:hypothetical protein JXL21_04360 [Candidatus Bathyarchaeota archaeon]|nr:hypothetical protein [Candidatus Bathyarchaeota archaeon]